MSSVTVDRLYKKYGKVEAVKEVSFVVEEGEFTVLLGPSGCGKTTTLRCIAGLEIPNGGTIKFDDEDVTNLSPAARNIAFVFQLYALYPHLSVYDNIAFPLRAEKLAKEEVKKQTEQVLKLLQIEDVQNMKPRKLTSGQKQRVALGRAIVRRPRVFLLDEPLSNIDAKLREMTRAELKKLQKTIGATTLYVTHDQVEAMTMADKIVVMNFGDIQQIGTPHEVYHYPTNLFVARFIGSPGMNFISGKIITELGKVLVELPGQLKAGLNEKQQDALSKSNQSRDVVLGVRPEDVRVFPQEETLYPAEVYVFEPLGVQNIVTLKIADTLIKATLSGDVFLQIGEKVSVSFREIRIFDKQSEKLIA